jgi:5-methylcytosine-specific restriction protein A
VSLRPCTHPRCPTLTRDGRCDQHRAEKQRQGDAQRGTAQERGYDYQWSLFSKQWIAGHPVCGMRADLQLHADDSLCVQRGIHTTTDLVTDHRVPMADGGAKFDADNLQTLCRACNTRKDSGWTH